MKIQLVHNEKILSKLTHNKKTEYFINNKNKDIFFPQFF